ncbi:MAG: type II toxin-antitoxin system ParD family antitoxin [Chloroflexi bacterium]|nr:type II toxin-antitoxin system ParD family antitoxin [Chloroflexota bacterium]
MPTRNISLTDHFERLIEDSVASGEYQNASEVVRAALRLLERQQQADEAKLKALREAVQIGIDQSDRGEGILIERHDLHDFIHRLGEEASQQVKART